MYYGVSMTLFVTDNDNDGDNWQKYGHYGMEWNMWYDMLCCYLSSDIVVEEEVCIGVDSVLQPPQPVRHLLCLPVQHVDVRHLLRSLPQDRVQTFPLTALYSSVSNFTILDSLRLAMQRGKLRDEGLGGRSWHIHNSWLHSGEAALAWHLHDILLIVDWLDTLFTSELDGVGVSDTGFQGELLPAHPSALQVDIVHHLTKTGQPPPTKSCQESSHILVEPHTCLKQRGTERLLDGVPERHSVNSVLPTLTQEKPYSRWCLLGRRASTGERGSRDEQPLIQRRAAPLTARNHNSSSLIKCSMLISMLIHQKSIQIQQSKSYIWTPRIHVFSATCS